MKAGNRHCENLVISIVLAFSRLHCAHRRLSCDFEKSFFAALVKKFADVCRIIDQKQK